MTVCTTIGMEKDAMGHGPCADILPSQTPPLIIDN